MQKNNLLAFIVICLGVVIFTNVLAQAADDPGSKKQELLQKAQEMKVKIEGECRKDPMACSCQQIPCEDILDVEDVRAKEAYDRCVVERNGCETQRQNGIKQMQEQREKISLDCKKDLNSCDCSVIENEDGKKECELAIIEAKYQAKKERDEKTNSCYKDLDACDCSTITNDQGRVECFIKIEEAKKQRTKIEGLCRDNPMVCDCSVIESPEGKNECEMKRAEGIAQAENAVKTALSKCFKDVEVCNCGQLGLEKQEFIDFCDVQKNYGLNCKREGRSCEKLENVEIYPAGMPAWLGKFFAKTYKSYIEAEKESGVKQAAGLISTCLTDPEKCECDKTPEYARAFCERNKALQVQCEKGNYSACIVLDKTPNLPEGVPSFSYSFLDSLVNKLRNAQAQMIKANAARKVGAMILECMGDASKCDCSLAPSGNIKTFCEHKKVLVERCRNQKNYDSCFLLNEESVIPDGTPDIIRSYIESNVVPKINENKQKIFDSMKQGTACEKEKTIEGCKLILKK